MGFRLWALLLLLLPNDDASALSSEGWALVRFRSGIEDDPSNALVNWNADDEDPCRWFGIRCENGAVTSINLTGLSLKGTLAPELGQLTSLRELVLRENCLMGAIPFQFGELKNLEILDLSNNKLSGPLPQDLGNLSRFNPSSICETGLCCVKCLQTADFSGNYFEGELPTCFDHLPRFRFYHNCLSSEELSYQRSFEDCTKSSIAFPHRALLQTDGAAGVPSTSSTNTTNVTVLGTSVQDSPAPSPVTVPSTNTLLKVPSESPSSEGSPAPSPDPEESSNNSSEEPSKPPSQPPSSSADARSSSKSRVVWVALSISSAVILVSVGILVFLCYRHKAAAVRPWKSSMSGELQREIAKGVPAISRNELEAACEGFSNIIGSSPNIVLFKGTLADCTEIAVISIRKSAKSWSSNSEMIFWRKVESLSQMNHPNLVNLIGYYAEEDPFVRMLVFEYVPNGTVFEHLHNKEFEHLDWGTRMRIIMGVAYALEYMHHGLEVPITHTKLDAKAVYLTEDYSAKLADFGVWKASSRKEGKASSEQTDAFGNDDLELSDRLVPDLENSISDFGVFLLEVVSGRPTFCKELGSISEWAMDYLGPLGVVDRIVDPTLKAYNSEELKVIGSLAMECLQEDKSMTLTMKQIVAHLSSSLRSLDEPAVAKSSPLLWAELEILSQE